MSKIFFSSDHHFYHANIIKLCNRPFSSVIDMNEAMIRLWNETVSPEDTVHYLGDFSMAFRPVELYTHRLNGTKYLVPGNHDYCHTYNKKSRTAEGEEKWFDKYEECGWTVFPEELTLPLIKDTVLKLCHLPYGKENSNNDDVVDKYEQWRPKNDADLLLCGHVHNKWKTKDNMINVGVDVWDYKPVSLDEILKLYNEINRGK